MNQVKSTDVKSTKSVQLSKSPRNKKSKKKQTVDSVAQEQKQIRGHLTREEKFNSASHHRGWSDWEAWCEKVTLAELKDELRAASQSVSRLMDKSNHAVETIAEHRRHAGEQYLRNFQCHSELIDYVHGEILFTLLVTTFNLMEFFFRSLQSFSRLRSSNVRLRT